MTATHDPLSKEVSFLSGVGGVLGREPADLPLELAGDVVVRGSLMGPAVTLRAASLGICVLRSTVSSVSVGEGGGRTGVTRLTQKGRMSTCVHCIGSITPPRTSFSHATPAGDLCTDPSIHP